GRTVYVGVMVALAAAVAVLVVAWWGYRSPWLYLFVVPVAASGCFVALSELLLQGGVDATEHGLRRVTRRARGTRFAPWRQVVDIRTERRGWRTVVVVSHASGALWRLRAPYDGRWLSHDPQFEPKLFNLRNLWETYRTRSIVAPDRAAGSGPAERAAGSGPADSAPPAATQVPEPPQRSAGTG
ncbi:MAG: hypothetical protein ACRDUA_20750, partial [Micromonosporaceae bacterium]